MNTKSVAILMTCHNRQAKTLASLEGVFKQELSPGVEMQVYLVDDGSTDGTRQAVETAYPQVHLLPGDGNLFWNGGMRLAIAEAMNSDYDYYLWLNDDTLLNPQAIASLLSTCEGLVESGENPKAIIVGSTGDPETGALTYGGMVRNSWWHPLKFGLLEPGKNPKPCDTMNGNCVLVSRDVVQVVGNLDPAFEHSTGDFDYGLRARQQGFRIWVAPGYVGTCPRNPEGGIWKDPEMKIGDRLKKASQSKGLPLREWKVFSQRHAGLFWPIYWLLPYARLLLISILRRPFGGTRLS
jgi:GT2 family glycosyltransferase